MRKKTILIALLLLCLAFFGCSPKEGKKPDEENDPIEKIDKIEDHENVRSFTEYVKDDILTELEVIQKGDVYLFKATRILNYNRECKNFTFNKEEARYVLLNSLGYFSRYVVHMDEECANSLELKIITEKADVLNYYDTVLSDIIFTCPVPIYDVEGYALSFEYIGDYEGKHRGLIKEFFFFERPDSLTYNVKLVNDTIKTIEEQDIDNLDTIPEIGENFETFYSYHVYDKDATYFYVNGYVESHSSIEKIIKGEYLIIFKDNKIAYDELSVICKYVFEAVGEGTNFSNVLDLELAERWGIDISGLEKVDRKIYKSFNENTTYDEFVTVYREILLMERWLRYIDNRQMN